MELCSKGSLERHIYSDKEVTREIFCKWGEQIVKGMSYLHLNKIVHRDLKPAKYEVFYVSMLSLYSTKHLAILFRSLVF